MIKKYMDVHIGKPTPKFLGILVGVIALVVIPLTIYQVQQQQEVRQRASEVQATWATTQSASSECPTGEGSTSGAEITVSFTNTEADRDSKEMTVTATDQQTNTSIDLGSIKGGETKTGTIATGKQTLAAGSVLFKLSWTDGHSGTDTRTATYNKVENCNPPTPTPSLPETTPTSSPSATPCPTLGPVKNVHIDCPNCL